MYEIGAEKGKYYSVNVPLKDGIDDQSELSPGVNDQTGRGCVRGFNCHPLKCCLQWMSPSVLLETPSIMLLHYASCNLSQEGPISK